MWTATGWFRALLLCAAGAVAAVAASECQAAAPQKPVAGQQIHFPEGTWTASPQVGPDGKVRQCVLLAPRKRAGKDGAIDTIFYMTIGRGAGYAIGIVDNAMPTEKILDDQAEIIIDGHSFPAVAFNIGPNLVMHPGDVAGALAALEKANKLTLRSDGAGIDSGPIMLVLPGEALAWLRQCGKIFNIATDRPTDPNAPEMPVPRARSPEVAFIARTPAGPPGIEDKQKISGWDASELRRDDGKVEVCLIRRHYASKAPNGPSYATFFIVSRSKGLTAMLKGSTINLPPDQAVDATMTIDSKPFTGFSARVLGSDEIGIYPEHGAALAVALEHGAHLDFKSKAVGMEVPVDGAVVTWLRACARRHGFGIEPESRN